MQYSNSLKMAIIRQFSDYQSWQAAVWTRIFGCYGEKDASKLCAQPQGVN